jgi:hypothetical protein
VRGSARSRLAFAGLALVAAGGGATGWAVGGLLDEPALRVPAEALPSSTSSRIPSGTRVVLSESDIQGMLAQHVPDALGVTVVGIVARLPGGGVIQAGVGVPARALLETTAPAVGRNLPAGWLARPVWLVLSLKPRVAATGHGGRLQAELDVVEFRMGSRRLPLAALRLLLDPVPPRALRWPLPRGVVSVTVERGRVVLSGGS